ncbi:hypothetical protein LG277_03425 [Vreelandella aquamarina]|uniref:hypothetical protein n=1 Tax=Vreelandella aquamarina TaxID=77097 RepID=UPI003850A30E
MSDQDNNSLRADHDNPWKMALESYFQEFLALLFPAINEQVVLSAWQYWQTLASAFARRHFIIRVGGAS